MVGTNSGELKYVCTVVGYTFGRFIAARIEIPNLRLSRRPPTRELPLPPGLLKINEKSNRHGL